MESTGKSSDEFEVTFRFVGDNIEPEMITSKLGIPPSKAHIKNDIVKKHPERTYPTGYWGINSSKPTSSHLGEQLTELLDILESHSKEIKDLIITGLSASFYCGIFISEGDNLNDTLIEFDTRMLQRIANMSVPLEIHIYCDNES